MRGKEAGCEIKGKLFKAFANVSSEMKQKKDSCHVLESEEMDFSFASNFIIRHRFSLILSQLCLSTFLYFRILGNLRLL
jgi:hypothetical protein